MSATNSRLDDDDDDDDQIVERMHQNQSIVFLIVDILLTLSILAFMIIITNSQ